MQRIWYWEGSGFTIVGETWYSYCRDLMYQAIWDSNEDVYFFYEKCPE